MSEGTVKWFDDAKGYGFIDVGEDEDVFVHFSAVKGKGFKSLKEGQNVNFNIISTEKGRQAESVEVID